MSGCAICGRSLAPNKAPGRPRKFCSERCRKAQYDLVCVDCGGRVSGTDPGRRPDPSQPRCPTCAAQHSTVWTEEAILLAIQEWADEHGGIPPRASEWRRAGDGWPSADHVVQRMGWANAIERAGFSRPEPSKYGRLGEDPEFCRMVAERYEAGESAYRLARELGFTDEPMRAVIRRGGATIRPAPGRAPTIERTAP